MLRLKELRQKNKISQQKLAEQLGVTQATLSGWENEKYEIDNTSLIRLSEYFCVSVDYLLGRVDDNIKPFLIEKTIKIPILGRIPAGIPIEAIEDIQGYIEISSSMTRGDKEFFALQIKGNSMMPKYIDGDVVLFEIACTCKSGDECAVMVNGDDATFKKVEIKENGIILKPLNSEYETVFYTNEEVENKPVRIIGIARELRRSV